MANTSHGKHCMSAIMWKPSPEQIQSSQMMSFINFANKKFNFSFNGYYDLYAWSINETSDFWECFWELFCNFV